MSHQPLCPLGNRYGDQITSVGCFYCGFIKAVEKATRTKIANDMAALPTVSPEDDTLQFIDLPMERVLDVVRGTGT